ncbi:RNA-binding protein MEX3B [Episyrphus balteatus]|uniref:RNA-binding protein MEX3B n=1 Tax=Episyrphus balteatus TaxID=286459 RepID=UPI002486BDB8|nr:RNA-binding protein MEX3B [Episyrphus balteatus]XP_055858227.1 RNA-binding protein MEX3B [Episyrphus balteatus]
MTTLYSDLERTTGNVGGSCNASTSFSTSVNSSQTSQQQQQQSASAVSAAVAVAAAELRQHHHQQQQQQSVVSSSQTIINGNPSTLSVSSSSSSSMSSSSSNISGGSPISSSPQSNPNSSIGTPSLTGSPSSSTNLVGLSNCTSSSSGISSLSGVSLNGGGGGSRVNMGSNSTLIEDPRTLQLALELSMVGLSDTMQAAAVAAALNNGHGHSQRPQQQQQQNQHLNHHLQQQQLQPQQIHSQYDLTCGLTNASAGIMQPTNVLPPGTTLNQFAASILPTLEDRSKKSQNMTECVPVPSSEHVAEIVGRQGCKIKALRAKTNTYIKTPVRGEEPVFVVTGRKEDVAKAKREILSAAEHFSLIRASRKPILAGNLGKVPPGPPSIPGQVTIQVRVPYRVVGLVVGPKGATIKHIQQETHTYIVTPSREKEPIFEVTGLPDNVQAARKQIEAHIALRTGNLSPSVQTINSLSQMFIGDELSPEFLASIYKNGICSTFDYVDAQVSPDDGSGCNMVVPNHANASNMGAFNGNANHHLQQQQQQHHQQQHQLHQAGNVVVSASNLVINGLMGGNNTNSGIVNNSINGNGMVGGVIGSSTGGSRSCSSSSSSTSSKSATNSRPELMNIWKNLGESLDVDEGLGESPNIWTLPPVTGQIGCSPSQSVSPTDSLLGGAGGSTGSNNITNMISSTSAANAVNNSNRAGLISTASQQLNSMRRECLVCGDKEVTAALVPCGHNMFCMECANHICTSVDGCCPVCSQTVYHAMRILP